MRSALAEPLLGTAPERAASWLLLEHPGPWPSSEHPADLPAAAAAVVDAATAAGVRPQLIRRVRARRAAPALVVVASCRPGNRWVEQRELTDLRALADLDVDALAAGHRPGFGAPSDDPVVLVCTHGRRDVCCARLGRPVAQLLDAALPGQVWETTHVGGDRFAANVVALPDGSYHGGLAAGDVPELAAALRRHEVLPARLRGLAGQPVAEQAADALLRQSLGVPAVDAVQVLSRSSGPRGEQCVELFADGVRWCVHVRTRPSGPERLTSCADGGTLGAPESWDLVSLQRVG